jgi:hypothetical protein
MTEHDGATAQAQEKAQEVAGQAREQAQQAAGQAKDQVRAQVDQRSTQAGEQVSQQAGDIRAVAEQLREQGKDGPAKLAEQAADRAERVGSYLQQSDADRILGDVEDFARQRPWAVVAGGIALGFAASRFLKSSQGDRYRSQTTYGAQSTPSTPATPALGGTGPGPNGAPPPTVPAPVGNQLSSGVPSAHPATPATPATGRL